MRSLVLLACCCMGSALAAPVQLRLLEWGYLPAGYEQQFAEYAKREGVEATVTRIEPLLTDFDSVYRALRTRSADVVMPTSTSTRRIINPSSSCCCPSTLAACAITRR